MKEIREIYFSDKIILEKDAKGKTKFYAPFWQADKPNKNKRIYSSKLIKKEIKRLVKPLQARSVFGGAKHPVGGNLEVPDVSHRIDKIDFDEKEGVAYIAGTILDTQKGKDLLTVLKSGMVGLSSRGYGKVTKQADGNFMVNDDYQLLSIDFTTTPSEPLAQIGPENLFESASFEVSTEEKQLRRILFDEAKRSGYKSSFKTWLNKIYLKKR